MGDGEKDKRASRTMLIPCAGFKLAHLFKKLGIKEIDWDTMSTGEKNDTLEDIVIGGMITMGLGWATGILKMSWYDWLVYPIVGLYWAARARARGRGYHYTGEHWIRKEDWI